MRQKYPDEFVSFDKGGPMHRFVLVVKTLPEQHSW